MRQIIFLLLSSCFCFPVLAQKDARYREITKTYTTYPFSDPDPVPAPAKLYPYFRFEGFTDRPVEQQWKVVVLENDYIQVEIFPEIGGKVWTAIDKKTGKPFLYNNDVVKFRDIAMRGPWVSGGIEANYGVIGHTPNTATPVDYLAVNGGDGSVSCYVSTLDLLTRTRWILEIRLEKDKAYFTTRSFWFNSTGAEEPYYTWMNAGIPAGEDLQFLYPGTHYIGHGGDAAPWPVDSTGRNLSYYKENAFGGSKSYHVLGSPSTYFGALWHDSGFGMIHYAPREDKLGKKIFLWAQSRSGGIWEDLLTDDAGQYVEIQSGRLFNQNQFASSATPFKQIGFEPYSSDTWTEYWYPFSGLQGFSAANRIGAYHIRQNGNTLELEISPVQPLDDSLRVWDDSGNLLASTHVQALPMEPVERSLTLSGAGKPARISIKGEVLYLRETMPGDSLSRPVETASGSEKHDNSAYGLYIQGRDLANFRNYSQAETKLHLALQKNADLVPALAQMARVKLFGMQYDSAFYYSSKALAADTYDGASNYYYARSAEALGQITDALDGYQVASLSPFFRNAAYTALARLYLKQSDLEKARDYAVKAANQAPGNLEALRIRYLLARKQGEPEVIRQISGEILGKNPLSHFTRFETYLSDPTEENKSAFTDLIRNEMPAETYLELGIWYANVNQHDAARAVLELAPAHPEVLAWLAWLYKEKDPEKSAEYLRRMQNAPARLVFPFRQESAKVFGWAAGKTGSWQADYYLALIEQFRGNHTQALALLMKHDKADFAPFYVLRARLNPSDKDKLSDLQQAVRIDPGQWRYGMFLSRTLNQQGKEKDAINLLSRYYKQSPDNYILGMDYARLLIDQHNYSKAETLLDKLHILPFEGATDARNFYRKTKLMLAHEAIEKKQFDNALDKIKQAEEWPEHLGVGKPYDNLIDNSIEQVMRQKIYQLSGKGSAVPDSAVRNAGITAANYLQAIEALTKSQDQRLF